MNFADRITKRTRELGHPLCVGLDPYVDLIPPVFRGRTDAETVYNFFSELLDLLSNRIAVVKPQISLFERLGLPGLESLQRLVALAKSRGLLVLLDAKRGDIGDTARGYADAYLGDNAYLDVDALTVNPYMGLDSLEPFVAAASTTGKGVFVLVRNSNPGADVFQKLRVDDRYFFEFVAASLSEFEERLLGQCGWSSLGVTVSARSPDDSLRARSRLPRALHLVLGYGAQGATAVDAVASLRQGSTGFEGGVVHSSRAVIYPADLGDSWERAIMGALSNAIRELQEARSNPSRGRHAD
jgi:orotidine-5'-phosphate decarboxylase